MTDNKAEVRKRPQQGRAQQRFDLILDAAESLVREKQSCQFGMNELARQAGVNIASIYQYFSGRPAILRELVTRLSSRYRETMIEALASPLNDLDSLVDLVLDGYFGLLEAEPVYGILWSELRLEPELRDLDIEDTRENAATLALALADHFPTVGPGRLERIAFLACELTYAVMRLKQALPDEDMAVLLDEYRCMLKAALHNI